MSVDPITQALARWQWLLWLIVVAGVFASVWSGVMAIPDPPPEPAYRGLDMATVVIGAGAMFMLLITQAMHSHYGSTLDRASRWIALGGWTVLELRFAWLFALLGDVPVHPLPMAALCALGIASMVRCLSIWEERTREERSCPPR